MVLATGAFADVEGFAAEQGLRLAVLPAGSVLRGLLGEAADLGRSMGVQADSRVVGEGGVALDGALSIDLMVDSRAVFDGEHIGDFLRKS